MFDHGTIELNRHSWNTISAQYQAHTRISTADVHYGALASGERELRLLRAAIGAYVADIQHVGSTAISSGR